MEIDPSTGLSDAALMTNCQLQASIESLNFTGGGTVNEILRLISPLLKDFIVRELDNQVCMQLGYLVETNFTAALQDIDEAILPFFDPSTPLLTEGLKHKVEMEPHNGIIGLLDYAFRELLNLNFLIDKLTQGTGEIQVSGFPFGLSSSFNVSIGDLANLRFDLIHLTVGGLNTWEKFDLFQPLGPYDLLTATTLKELSINLTFSLNLTTHGNISDSAYLYEEARFYINLTENDMNLTTFIELDQPKIAGLSPPEWQSVGNIHFFSLFNAILLFSTSNLDCLQKKKTT